jgi:hypothetical protein
MCLVSGGRGLSIVRFFFFCDGYDVWRKAVILVHFVSFQCHISNPCFSRFALFLNSYLKLFCQAVFGVCVAEVTEYHRLLQFTCMLLSVWL